MYFSFIPTIPHKNIETKRQMLPESSISDVYGNG